MWQKLNRIDIYELEKARTQLVSAARLASAAPRTYLTETVKSRKDWLLWNTVEGSMETELFGSKEKIRVKLAMEQFVLSLSGSNDHVEHLVLSGITYPMAFGWMKIKLDSFHLKGELFTDEAPFEVQDLLGTDEEMKVTNQKVFSDLAIYFSNAYHVLQELTHILNCQGKIRINPHNLNLLLVPENRGMKFNFGFSPGDKTYLEPYFYIELEEVNENILHHLAKTIGIWNNKNWNGIVYLSNEFITLDPESEQMLVMNFFEKNYWRLMQH